jgi:5-methylcytosine-specific restriction endonuclease McrA
VQCRRCKVKRGTWTIIRCVPPHPRWNRGWYYARYTVCIDSVACRARVEKKRARARTRSSLLRLAEGKAPDAPRGTCRWCGEPIFRVLPNGKRVLDKRRNYHDKYVRDRTRWDLPLRDPPEPPCKDEHLDSFTWTPRIALQRRGDPCCVDCGSEGPWDADHEVPLEDGGEHTLENLVRRCTACHKAKTAREASARAALRRAG